MNSAMMPREGLFASRQIDSGEFAKLAIEAHRSKKLRSNIGYPETAAFIQKLTGVKVDINRDWTQIEHGDAMLCIRLKYRVQNPSDKSRVKPGSGDYEFFAVSFQELCINQIDTI